jgi:hypothetical protein
MTSTIAGAMTEKELMANVTKLLGLLGYLTYHTRFSFRSNPGFPDIVAVHPIQKRTIWIELKREKGKVSPDQAYWIETLKKAGNEVYVIRPSDWLSDEVAEILRRKPSRGSAYGPDMDHVSSWINPDGSPFRVKEGK